MAAFNRERVTSERFGRCDFVAMVEAKIGRKKQRGAQVVRDLGPVAWMGGHSVGHGPDTPWIRHSDTGTKGVVRSTDHCTSWTAGGRYAPKLLKSVTTGRSFCRDEPHANETALEVVGGWLAYLLQVLDLIYESRCVFCQESCPMGFTTFAPADRLDGATVGPYGCLEGTNIPIIKKTKLGLDASVSTKS